MVLKSYSKINLNLIVNKKLNNNLHDLQSLFCLIDLFDKIYIKKSKYKKDQILFKGAHSQNVDNKENSVKKILFIMRKLKLISNFYYIKVIKRIPVFAGLGGGTSNAYTIFNFLNKRKIKRNVLNKIINYVGSDFRLFFHNQGFLMNLNKVKKLKKSKDLHFILAYPKLKCSTKKIYSMVKNFSSKKNYKANDISIDHVLNFNNELQSIVEKKHPIIKKLLFDIRNESGCFLSRMTGSGSACYGLFIDKNCSKTAISSLRKKYPKFWFSLAKTI